MIARSPSPTHRASTRKRAALVLFVLLASMTGSAVFPKAVAAQSEPLQVPPAYAACPEMTDSVFRLYLAYFLRLPDQGGYDFWIQSYAAGDFNLTTMSDFFAQSPEFQQRYSALDDEAFIELVYLNVLGRTPDREGFFFWLDELRAGRVSRGGLMAFFSESPEFIDLTGTLPPLAGHFSAYPEGTTWACGTGTADLVREPGGSFLDLSLLNLGPDDANAEITLWTELRQIDDRGTWILPAAHQLFVADYALSPQVGVVSIVVDPGVVWIYVSQPTSIGSSRPGWGVRTAAMTSTEHDLNRT